MDSVRSFLAIWALLTGVILGYAVIDLRLHPELYDEKTFSMTPDLSQIGTLPHWGGRLLKERAHGLLVCNAVALAGMMSLSGGYVAGRIKKRRAAGVHGRARLAERSAGGERATVSTIEHVVERGPSSLPPPPLGAPPAAR